MLISSCASTLVHNLYTGQLLIQGLDCCSIFDIVMVTFLLPCTSSSDSAAKQVELLAI